jgi:hypothetical protein
VIARAARRLPGIGFESRPPRPPDVLPRMDVAAFVGFAASGPLDTPVPVDDPAAFADVFGDDAALAWDRDRSELVRANLGPAVRSFFRNGGQRAFVVRVAGPTAAANHFPVPGLLHLTAGGLQPAFLAARSEGSWCDGFDVGAVAAEQAETIGDVTFDGGSATSVTLLSPDTVAPGDLLSLRWPDGEVLLASVDTIDGPDAALADGGALWLLGAPPALPGTWTASFFPRHDGGPAPLPAVAGAPTFSDEDGTATVTLVDAGLLEVGHLVLLARGVDRVWLDVTSIDAVELPGSPPVPGFEVGGRWTRPVAPGTPGAPASAPAGTPACVRVRVELWVRDGGVQPVRLGDLGLGPGHPRYLGALPADARLFAMDDDLLDDAERALRDRVRAMVGDGVDLRSYHADLWQAVATPRFPLAAADDARVDFYFPAGLPIVPDVYRGPEPVGGDAATRDGLASFSVSPFVDPALADESVRSLLGQADHVRWQQPAPRLLTGMHSLLEVDDITLVAVPDAVHRGWTTEDVVAPAPLDTPVLTATADAAGLWHLAWTAVDPAARYLLESSATPGFEAPTVVPRDPAATTYDVPAPPDPSAGVVWFRVRAYIPQSSDPSTTASYFVVADQEAAGSFWSDPVLLVTPPPEFVGCPAGALAAPVLSLAAPPDANGTFLLTWTAVPGALRYVVEESDALDFLGSTIVFTGPGQDVTIYGRAAGRYHYRVHAEGSEATVSPPIIVGGDGAVFDVTGTDTPQHLVLAIYVGAVGEETVFDGDAFTERFAAGSTRAAIGGGGFRYRLVRDDGWPGAPAFRAFSPDVVGPPSNGVTAMVAPPARRVLAPAEAYQAAALPVLLGVQAALTRMAAARGDLLAVLALPEHYRAPDAVTHVSALRDAVPEDTAWSYAALYHPWLLLETADADGILRAPPDGALCGAMATRASTRGAWIAPANQPLGDVLGLSPAIAADQRQRLYEAQVNLVRQEPHGFVTMSADTLSSDPDLMPINVRRLLVLIRRIALREGPAFVFEPNGSVFRRGIARQFESLLGGMFRAGAFAGDTAASSFQVAVDASINTQASLDQGRFIVELKVAPSLPLSFLTVRLVQNGSVAEVTEGA